METSHELSVVVGIIPLIVVMEVYLAHSSCYLLGPEASTMYMADIHDDLMMFIDLYKSKHDWH